MNHTLNARLHALPPCPECGVAALLPCRSDTGSPREPHRSRPVPPTLNAIAVAGRAAASADTAYPDDAATWTPEQPLHGHCGAMAWTVRALRGGVILSGRDVDGERWLWNQLPHDPDMAPITVCLIRLDWAPPDVPNPRLFNPKRVNPRFRLFEERVRALLAQGPKH